MSVIVVGPDLDPELVQIVREVAEGHGDVVLVGDLRSLLGGPRETLLDVLADGTRRERLAPLRAHVERIDPIGPCVVVDRCSLPSVRPPPSPLSPAERSRIEAAEAKRERRRARRRSGL